MAFTSKRNRMIVGINLLLFGILIGYQNCSDNGLVFTKAKIESMNGELFSVTSISGDRFVGDTDTYRVQAEGETKSPAGVSWTLQFPDSRAPKIEVSAIEFAHTYDVPGWHKYNVVIMGSDNIEVVHKFDVNVKVRPPDCTPANAPKIQGPSSLSLPGRAKYQFNFAPACFNLVGVPVWRVKTSEGVDVTASGSPALFPLENAFEYTFASGTYTVEVDVIPGQSENVVTFTLDVTVGAGDDFGGCGTNPILYDNSCKCSEDPCDNVFAGIPSCVDGDTGEELAASCCENLEPICRSCTLTSATIDFILNPHLVSKGYEYPTSRSARIELPEGASAESVNITYKAIKIEDGESIIVNEQKSNELEFPLSYEYDFKAEGEKKFIAEIFPTMTQKMGKVALSCPTKITKTISFTLSSSADTDCNNGPYHSCGTIGEEKCLAVEPKTCHGNDHTSAPRTCCDKQPVLQ